MQGKTPIYLAVDGKVMGVMAVSDTAKPQAAAAVAALRAMGVESAMLTGDAQRVALAVASDLRIQQVHAELMPGDKVNVINSMRPGVAFVGDGINDAPALAAADVGLAIGTGTDIAIEAAEVVLTSGDPQGVATAIHISRAVLRNIKDRKSVV